MKHSQQVPVTSPKKVIAASNTTLARVTVGTMIAHLAEHVFAMALAPLLILVIQDIPMTLTQIGILSTIQVVPNVVLGLLYGILADRYGSKFFIISGAGLSSLGVYLTALATTYSSLLLAQILLGVALSAYHPTGLCMVTRVFSKHPKMLGRGLSVQGIGGAGGSGLAPLLMVILAEWTGGWRSALNALAILGFGATVIVTILLLTVREDIEPSRAIQLPKAEEPKSTPSRGNRGLLTASFVMLLIFAFTRSSVFRNAMYFFPYYFTSLGYSIFDAGLFTSLFFGMGAVFQIIGGVLADRLPSQKNIFLVSSTLSGIAAILMIFLSQGIGLIMILVLFGGSFFIAIPSMSVSVSRHAPRKSQGIIFAVFFAVISLFGALSSSVFGWIGDTWSLQMGILFVAAMCFFGAVFSNRIQETPVDFETSHEPAA